jgi:hypothetical protein
MQWACVRDATGRDFNQVLARSSGRIVPSRAGAWEKDPQSQSQSHTAACVAARELKELTHIRRTVRNIVVNYV